MQIHQLKRKTLNKKPRAVGRGGKRGKTSGRGHKGQNARAGTSKRPELRDFIKKLPKLRGRGVNTFKSVRTKPSTINLKVLEENLKDGENVSPQILVEKGLIKRVSGKVPKVKILSQGDINKKITVSNCLLSVKAKEKIEKTGGKVD